MIYYVQPSEEELFLRYNPELQKRSLENRVGKQEDFDAFVGKLKEYSKSDKPSTFYPCLKLEFWRLRVGDLGFTGRRNEDRGAARLDMIWADGKRTFADLR